MKKTRIARSFYTRRNLPEPTAEYWPENSQELSDLLTQPRDIKSPPRVIIGDGQQLRPQIIANPDQPFDVIRTTKCTKTITFDVQSGLIRTESGITWRDLQETVTERGFSMHNYNLYPATSTLGGLLSQRHLTDKSIFYGDIREGCVALTAITPAHERYRYIPAPRKASGPDFRYLYLGTEGQYGAILDATMIVTRPQPGRLFQFETTDLDHTITRTRQIFACGIRPSWTHYEHSNRTLSIAIHAPEPLLQSTEKHLRTHVDPNFNAFADDILTQRRRYLEERHPNRRSAPSANRTHAATFDLSELSTQLNTLGISSAAPSANQPQLQIYNWNQNQALAYITYPTTEIMHQTLARFTKNTTRDTTPTPAWAHTLKTQLDAQNTLATGPANH